MIRTVSAREAEALIAAGELDVVDVREPHEYAEGHVPGARSVPLAQLKAAPTARLPRDRVLFVCARGSRSQSAATAAEAAGLKELFSLDGGTIAWEKAGLPMERPAAPAASASASASASPPAFDTITAAGESCGLPEPGLDVVVGANMRALRTTRNVSLDQLARQTGLSRTLLGQIELGKTAPSVSVVWRIAQAFQVHFSALLATSERAATSVLRAGEARRLVSPDGRFSSRALFPFAERPDAEFYELFLAPHSREDAQPHQAGTRENLVVTSGRLELHVGGQQHELAKGDAIVFTADVPHAYVNPGSQECWMYLVMTYAGGVGA
jgi:rhodanese-related sulfurtransferase/transcriptional regulator with XRE-family HTH domain